MWCKHKLNKTQTAAEIVTQSQRNSHFSGQIPRIMLRVSSQVKCVTWWNDFLAVKAQICGPAPRETGPNWIPPVWPLDLNARLIWMAAFYDLLQSALSLPTHIKACHCSVCVFPHPPVCLPSVTASLLPPCFHYLSPLCCVIHARFFK